MQPGNKQQGDVAVVSVLESDLPCPSSPASGLSRGRTEARAARRCGRSHAPLSCLRSPASLPGLQAHPREHGGRGSGCGGCPQGLGHHGGSGDACLEHLPASRCFRPKSQEGAPASVRAARHPAEPALPACSLTRTHVQTPRHTHHTHVYTQTRVHANTHALTTHHIHVYTQVHMYTAHTCPQCAHTAHTHVQTHVHSACMCVHKHMYTYHTPHTCVHTCTNTQVHKTHHIHVYKHTCAHNTYICTYTGIHTTYTPHTYTHTLVQIHISHIPHTYVHKHTCTHTIQHINMYTQTCPNTHVHSTHITYICTYTYTQAHVYTHRTHVYTHRYTKHPCTHTTHVCTHKHTHHIHTHTHTCVCTVLKLAILQLKI